ncbi:MAG: helix-turn-helix domain-containing protein [Acidobacteriota bacterium]|nr:helix-turn-helix domain-containing protein [Acidobacteriota bacterium]
MTIHDEGSESRRLARKARRRKGRREHILEAALELLETEGVESLTVTAVADAADVSTPALYYYFKSKEAIIDALAVMLIEEDVAAQMEALEAADDAVESLVGILNARLRHYADSLDRFQLIFQSIGARTVSKDVLENHLYPLSARVNVILEERLTQARDAGLIHPDIQPRKLANLAFCLAQGILQLTAGMARAGGKMRFNLDDFAEEAAATLRRACRPD